MQPRLQPAQKFPAIRLQNIHGGNVDIPDTQGWTHLQFRRFAGCPICNVHLQSFIARHAQLTQHHIREVVVFHSPDTELLPYQGRFPFDVIADPEKRLYKQFGVGTSRLGYLSLKTIMAGIKGNVRKDKPKAQARPHGGITGVPADFLIGPDGTLKAVHYGKHAYDQWTLDEVLALVKAA